MRPAAALIGLAALALAAQACTVQPGDGSKCSADPCSWCSGKADGVYADPGALGKTYFDCFAATSPGGAECLACRNNEQDAQCPSPPASPASPAGPASPAPVASGSPSPKPTPAPPAATSCKVQPGDGSTCSQDPCAFCAGKADGTYADPGALSKTFFDCFSAYAPGGAECLKCYGSGWSACPGAGGSATPATPAVPAKPVDVGAIAAQVEGIVASALGHTAGRKRLS